MKISQRGENFLRIIKLFGFWHNDYARHSLRLDGVEGMVIPLQYQF